MKFRGVIIIRYRSLLPALLILLSACTAAQAPHGDTQTSQDEIPEDTEKAVIEYPLTLKAAYPASEDEPAGIALQEFKERVEESTGGRILVQLYPDERTDSGGELIEKEINGDMDIAAASAEDYAVYVPKIGISALPFLFDDFESAWRFIDGPVQQGVNPELEAYDLHVLSYFDNGFKCVTSSEAAGPVRRTGDMAGLRICTSGDQIALETMSSLGASPRSFPYTDLKAALKSGLFDAQESSVPMIHSSRLYEEQKYLSLTNHSYDAMPLTIRKSLWDGLDPEDRMMISYAAKEAQKTDRELVKAQTEECISLLEQEGMTIVYPDTDGFRRQTKDVIKVFANVYGKELAEDIYDLTE